MDNQELLQAIEAMMDKKLAANNAEMLKVINERFTRVEVKLENDVEKRLSLLGEGQQMVVEKIHQLDKLTEKVEDIQNTVEVLKYLSVKEKS